MITRVIEHKYSKVPGIKSSPIKGPHELDKEKIKRFDQNENLIELSIENLYLSSIGMKNIEITTYKYDNKNNVVEKDFTKYPKGYGEISQYDNKYDKKGNLVSNDIRYEFFDGPGVSKKTTAIGKGEFEYNNLNKLIKSKIINYDKNDSINNEEIISITYDDEGDKKEKKRIYKQQRYEGGFYIYENKHKYFFDDIGKRKEEIKEYNNYGRVNEELTISLKKIITNDQLLQYDMKDNKLTYKESFYYDNKDRLIEKKCFYPHVLQDEPLDIYKYIYIESADSLF